MTPTEPAGKKREFLRGFGLSAAATFAAAVLLGAGVVAFAGGPQTGQDHALPATLALLLLSIGATQWVWLLPWLIWALRSGRRDFAWGILACGVMVAAIDAPLIWKIVLNR